MASMADEIADFRQCKASGALEARQRVALQIACGLDCETARQATGMERTMLVRRLRRLIERERLRGMRRHWSYDLNRHIALGQVLASLTGQRKGGASRHRPST